MMESGKTHGAEPAAIKVETVDEDGEMIVMAKAEVMPMEVGGSSNADGVFSKGEPQPNEYRDAWAAILFGIQAVAVLVVACVYAPYIGQEASTIEAQEAEANGGAQVSSSSSSSDGTRFLFLLAVCYGVAGFITMTALRVMMIYSESLVKVSFFFAPATFFAVAVLFYVAGDDDIAPIFVSWAVFISLITICCWFFYRHHVAFAAANLKTALTALRLNAATYGLAFAFSVLSFISMLVWVIGVVGLKAKADMEGTVPCRQLFDDDAFPEDALCDKNPPSGVAFFALLFCFYWTQQVIQNIVHVTTAGVVGSWWFSPLADPSCCSPTILGSLRRACTFSFGSICFGSLLVALMQLLEQLAKSRNRNGRGNLLTCIAQCILHCLRAWLEYFNSWAFVYVGLYGYGYIEAGKNVITLFRNRGWTTLIADRLVFRVLLFCNLGVGAICGCVAVILDFAVGPFFDSDDGDASASHLASFFFAFFVGLFISNVALFVVESAVRTVIVCFAESPAEFDEHHPELSETMKSGWTEAYPTLFGEGAAMV